MDKEKLSRGLIETESSDNNFDTVMSERNESGKKGAKKRVDGAKATAYLTKIAILSAIAFLMYFYVKFPLPMIFPKFLDIQISELPALLAGFSMGPVAGAIVVIVKCCIKMPFSSTACVGELIDILIGLSMVLPASIIYKYKKNIKGAVTGMGIGIALSVTVAMLANRFAAVPLYVKLIFNGSWAPLINMCKPLYPNITADNFYAYYIFAAVLPFNVLRSFITALLAFVLYKRLSKILHWEGQAINMNKEFPYPKNPVTIDIKGEKAMIRFGARFAKYLKGGERIVLEGDLGAGKTTFTKGLAKGLGVKEDVTSPTFTILNVYESGRLPLYHLDMYRIGDENEIYETGILDTINNGGVTVIEWNKLPDDVKACVIKIERTGENSRKVEVKTNELFSV